MPTLGGLRGYCSPWIIFPQVKSRPAADGQVARAWKSHQKTSCHSHGFPRQADCSVKHSCTLFLLPQETCRLAVSPCPRMANPLWWYLWVHKRGCQLLVHNSGSGHLCKQFFPRKRKGRRGDRLCTEDRFLPVNQSPLAASAPGAQGHTTPKAASSPPQPGPHRMASVLACGANHLIIP